MTTAIGVIIKRTVKKRKIPFEIIEKELFYTSGNIKRLKLKLKKVIDIECNKYQVTGSLEALIGNLINF